MSIRSSCITRPAAVLLFGGAVACAGSADAGFINRTNNSPYLEMGGPTVGIFGNLPSNWFASNSTYTSEFPAAFPDKLVFTSWADGCSVVKQNGSTGRLIINTLVLTFGVDAATSLSVSVAGLPTTNASLSEVGGSTLGSWGSSGGSGTFSLTTGKTYRMQFYCSEYPVTGSFLSGSVLNLQLAPVPAPGALALLGVAGLAPRRRRR